MAGTVPALSVAPAVGVLGCDAVELAVVMLLADDEAPEGVPPEQPPRARAPAARTAKTKHLRMGSSFDPDIKLRPWRSGRKPQQIKGAQMQPHRSAVTDRPEGYLGIGGRRGQLLGVQPSHDVLAADAPVGAAILDGDVAPVREIAQEGV
jgi:hypothetical protein